MSATLDVEKLRKVRSLMDGGSTAGERAAANSRAESIAKAAGMTLAAALSKLDAQVAAPKPASFFDGFDDWMEEKEPGHKARAATAHAEKERKRKEKCADLLKQYGSEEAVDAYTPREQALFAALDHMIEWTKPQGFPPYVSKIDGWSDYYKDAPDHIQTAVRDALPWPSSLAGIWAEWLEWETLDNDRHTFWQTGESCLQLPADVRRSILEKIGQTTPAVTLEDFRARLNFKDQWSARGISCDAKTEATFLAMMRSDIETLLSHVQSVQPDVRPAVRRTNADKRADVLRMLAEEGGLLSDREIARRVGVSPQTVNTWRKWKTSNLDAQ